MSASERLSRNHLAAEKQTRPQLLRHPQDGFDTDCSFVAVWLNRLRRGGGFDMDCFFVAVWLGQRSMNKPPG